MVSKITSIAPIGFEGRLIDVETDISKGLPGIQIVGMTDKAIDEAKDRVRRAIINSNLDFPKGRIIINLAPAELPKDGASFDLSIALSILQGSKQLSPAVSEKAVFIGELALDGEVRPVRGIINIVEIAKRHHFSHIYLPRKNLQQASLIKGIDLYPIDNLRQLFLHLKNIERLYPSEMTPTASFTKKASSEITLDDIQNQSLAKRALLIAAAGRHNILINGPPGTGKTMLAKTLPGLLPPLSETEKIILTKLYNLSGELTEAVIENRPFRSPHHTASRTSIIGGGKNPLPGEISLAHLGVLFLDELPEYPRSLIESLRQPLEDRKICISRVNGKTTFPANFMLVATMNPCPCGYYGDTHHECNCTSHQIINYQKKLSGPLLDRIDVFINMPRVTNDFLKKTQSNEIEQTRAKQQINKAQQLQQQRYHEPICNSSLNNKQILKHLSISPEAKILLDNASTKMQFSGRSYFKTIKIAQTIADLEKENTILPKHIAEALQYRAQKQ